MRALVFVFLGACASSPTTGDDASAPFDSGPLPDVTKLPIDSGSDTAAPDVFDAGCGDGIPSGSSASASNSYGSMPSDAIDGNLGTVWNAGGFTGSITIMFASPQTIDGVKIYANALPTTDETYTVFGIQDQQTIQLAQSTQNVGSGSQLAAIAITNAAYDGIRIDAEGNASWVAINEITFATTYCP